MTDKLTAEQVALWHDKQADISEQCAIAANADFEGRSGNSRVFREEAAGHRAMAVVIREACAQLVDQAPSVISGEQSEMKSYNRKILVDAPANLNAPGYVVPHALVPVGKIIPGRVLKLFDSGVELTKGLRAPGGWVQGTSGVVQLFSPPAGIVTGHVLVERHIVEQIGQVVFAVSELAGKGREDFGL